MTCNVLFEGSVAYVCQILLKDVNCIERSTCTREMKVVLCSFDINLFQLESWYAVVCSIKVDMKLACKGTAVAVGMYYSLI